MGVLNKTIILLFHSLMGITCLPMIGHLFDTIIVEATVAAFLFLLSFVHDTVC